MYKMFDIVGNRRMVKRLMKLNEEEHTIPCSLLNL